MDDKMARMFSGTDARLDALTPAKLGDILTASKIVNPSSLAIIAIVSLFCWLFLGLIAYLVL